MIYNKTPKDVKIDSSLPSAHLCHGGHKLIIVGRNAVGPTSTRALDCSLGFYIQKTTLYTDLKLHFKPH